jgi:hypothetical protein
VRIGQYCTKSLGSFTDVFTKIFLNFLSLQNILFPQGTALFQFMKELYIPTTQNLAEAASLMGIKGSMMLRGFRHFRYFGPLSPVTMTKILDE